MRSTSDPIEPYVGGKIDAVFSFLSHELDPRGCSVVALHLDTKLPLQLSNLNCATKTKLISGYLGAGDTNVGIDPNTDC